MKIAARIAAVLLLLVGAVLAAVPFLALVGLGVHRHAAPLVIATTAGLLVAAPPLAVAAASRSALRPYLFPAALAAWALVLHGALPVYFPGERRQAVATGLAILGFGSDLFGMSERLVRVLPDEPAMATPEVSEATPLVVAVPPPSDTLGDHEMALPYEGDGRRLSVPVTFGNGGTEAEVQMMLDTGATYTTLSRDTLAQLGIHESSRDPVIQLHTANGEREASLVLVDAVWLGDLRVDGVAIATCDDCATGDIAGLLGLNVAGGFNFAIDADRREVVFSRRARFDRQLDVKPFVDLTASFERYVGGRVEVNVRIDNLSTRPVTEAKVAVRCGDAEWTVDFGAVLPGVRMDTRRRLPPHEGCDQYEILLHEAIW